MGFYFRKSVKFGPVRFNFSKSGIGVSAGMKGARISTGPRGTYVHAGRGGFYYSQRIGGPDIRCPTPNYQVQATPRQDRVEVSYVYTEPRLAHVIETADVSRLVESSSAQLLNQINSATQRG